MRDETAEQPAPLRSGLTTGQQVIVYPPATVRDGQRVAARKPWSGHASLGLLRP